METDKKPVDMSPGEGLAGLVLVLAAENRDVSLADKIRCIGNFAIDVTARLIKTITP